MISFDIVFEILNKLWYFDFTLVLHLVIIIQSYSPYSNIGSVSGVILKFALIFLSFCSSSIIRMKNSLHLIFQAFRKTINWYFSIKFICQLIFPEVIEIKKEWGGILFFLTRCFSLNSNSKILSSICCSSLFIFWDSIYLQILMLNLIHHCHQSKLYSKWKNSSNIFKKINLSKNSELRILFKLRKCITTISYIQV